MDTSAPVGCGGGDRALTATLPAGTGRRGWSRLGRAVVGHIILENREEPGPDVDLVYVASVDECCTKGVSIIGSEAGVK
jgi:hypothetical protein